MHQAVNSAMITLIAAVVFAEVMVFVRSWMNARQLENLVQVFGNAVPVSAQILEQVCLYACMFQDVARSMKSVRKMKTVAVTLAVPSMILGSFAAKN